MATGNIRGGKRNYARPTAPSTSTATTAADTTNVSVSFTPSTLGPAATSYLVTATSTTAPTTSYTLTTSPTTVVLQTGATYTVNIAGQNYNGLGAAFAAATGLVIPSTYQLAQTFNAIAVLINLTRNLFLRRNFAFNSSKVHVNHLWISTLLNNA